MNILIVNPKISRHGGIERYIAEIAERLSIDSNKIYLFVAESEIEIPNVTIIKISVPKYPKWLAILWFAFVTYISIPSIKKKLSIDVVVSNGSATFSPDIVVAHSVHMDSIVKTNAINYAESKNILVYLRGLLRFIWPSNLVINFIELIAYKKAKSIIAVSSGVKKELIKRFLLDALKITSISNGVDTNKFHPDASARKEIRDTYKISYDKKIILFVGHEFKRKGLDYIIQAIPLINNKEAVLLVVGNDSIDSYKKLASSINIKDRVIFTGPIKKDIEKIYAASDIFVFPTTYEAFALVTLEAMSSGLPVITTEVNGTEELIENGKNGFFIERNSRDIADKLNLGFDKLPSLSEYARKTSLDFDWSIVAKKTFKAIENVAHI